MILTAMVQNACAAPDQVLAFKNAEHRLCNGVIEKTSTSIEFFLCCRVDTRTGCLSILPTMVLQVWSLTECTTCPFSYICRRPGLLFLLHGRLSGQEFLVAIKKLAPKKQGLMIVLGCRHSRYADRGLPLC